MKNILFVCTGNTCRSPMAEGLSRVMARQESVELEVRSAGVSAIDGMPVTPHSKEILRNAGVERVNDSRSLAADHVQWADIILTMTLAHKRLVIQQYPEAVDKTFMLKEFAEEDQRMLRVIEQSQELMSELQLKQVLGQPVTADEQQRLLQLSRSQPDYDIADPFGGTLQEYENTAYELKQAIAAMLRKLKS